MKKFLIVFFGIALLSQIVTVGYSQEWTDYNTHDPGRTAIPDWVKNNFKWYVDGAIDQESLLTSMNWLLDNNYMHLSDKAAKEVDDLRNEQSDALKEINDLKTELTTVRKENTELRSMLGNESDRLDGRIDLVTPKIESSKTSLPPKIDANIKSSNANEQPTEEVAFYFNKISFASDTVDDIIVSGGTASDWSKGIATFSEHGMSDGAVDDLQSIVVLCNHEVSKKTQTIDAELNIIGQWLDIIEKNQPSHLTVDPATGSTDSSTTSSQYRESDLDFIERRLASIDQQIIALDTGINVMKDKLSAIGDDAQMANIDLQNSLQKQQQLLQTISNISKNQHDTLKSIIQNMR